MGQLAVSGYHHVALTVLDITTSAAWYEELFDLELLFDEPGEERQAKVYRLRGTSALLGLVQHAGNDGSAFRPDRTGLDHAAFVVPTRTDIDAWAARLDEKGIEHSGAIPVPNGAILNFSDPDCVALSIFWDAG